MVTVNLYGICIRNAEGKIISIARERYDKTLIFDSPNETTTEEKEVSLYKDARSAKASATARSKYGVHLTNKVLEELISSVGEIEYNKCNYVSMKEMNTVKYKDIKQYITPCELSIDYNILD